MILKGIRVLLQDADISRDGIGLQDVIVENPPKPEYGDIAFPMFQYAKLFRINPARIAEKLQQALEKQDFVQEASGSVEAMGPYVNVRLHRAAVIPAVLEQIAAAGDRYGLSEVLKGQKILVEFSCPNTNKPLHLGHLRNDAIGQSISHILSANGAQVIKVNLINDRGIHICQSMLAYRRYGDHKVPEDEGLKSDHFVGKYYVLFQKWADEFPEAHQQAQELLKKWEQGDAETIALWKKMNEWTVDGIEKTYRDTGISFDRVYHESDTYLLGRTYVRDGVKNGLFYQESDGSVWIDLTSAGLDKKVLLRSDGTSLYITQDIGTAVQRYQDWHFDRMVYIVASEQQYHFQVLFQVLKRLKYEWAEQLHHIAYGMVNLPEGKMKSREGTVVDADDLLEKCIELARSEIYDKGRQDEVADLDSTTRKIALAAINYYLLQTSPYKDMIFNPEASISFTGNTGPYLQYTAARITSMLTKFSDRSERYREGTRSYELLSEDAEWDIVKLLGAYPEKVHQSAVELNPVLLCIHLHEIAKSYSRYYQEYPVLHNDDPHLVVTRIELSRCVHQVLVNGLRLLGIPILDKM